MIMNKLTETFNPDKHLKLHKVHRLNDQLYQESIDEWYVEIPIGMGQLSKDIITQYLLDDGSGTNTQTAINSKLMHDIETLTRKIESIEKEMNNFERIKYY